MSETTEEFHVPLFPPAKTPGVLQDPEVPAGTVCPVANHTDGVTVAWRVREETLAVGRKLAPALPLTGVAAAVLGGTLLGDLLRLVVRALVRVVQYSS